MTFGGSNIVVFVVAVAVGMFTLTICILGEAYLRSN